MSARTKILVFRMKELVYTGIFIVLGILFIILLILMFAPGKKDPGTPTEKATSLYVPGVYTTSVTLGDMALDIELVVDADYIRSLRLVNIDEAVTTMYPLIEPAFDNLCEQIIRDQSLSRITYDQDSRYTTGVLLHAIERNLLKAQQPLDSNE